MGNVAGSPCTWNDADVLGRHFLIGEQGRAGRDMVGVALEQQTRIGGGRILMAVHDAHDEPDGLDIDEHRSVVGGAVGREDARDVHVDGVRPGEVENVFRIAHQRLAGPQPERLGRRCAEQAIAEPGHAGAIGHVQAAEIEILQGRADDRQAARRVLVEDRQAHRQTAGVDRIQIAHRQVVCGLAAKIERVQDQIEPAAGRPATKGVALARASRSRW